MYFSSNLKSMNLQLNLVVSIALHVAVTMLENKIDPNTTTMYLGSIVNTEANTTTPEIQQGSWQNTSVFINITMTTEVISACRSGQAKLRIRAKKGHIYVTHQPDSLGKENHTSSKELLSRTCLLEIEVTLPTDMIMHIKITNYHTEEKASILSVYDSLDYPSLFTASIKPPYLKSVTSYTNDVIFKFTSEISQAITWLVQFDGVIKTSKHNLEIFYTSPTHGTAANQFFACSIYRSFNVIYFHLNITKE